MANLEEFIDEIDRGKAEGVELYRDGKYAEAITVWKEAAKMLLKTLCTGPEALANSKLSVLDHVINSNLAMAHYKTGDFSTCVMFCDRALLRRKTMPRDLLEKNLYRKASAEYELLNYEKCKQACELLLEEFPSNAAGVQLLKTVEREIAEEVRTEKSNHAKMFHKLDDENRKPA
jgi:hypothetical protein